MSTDNHEIKVAVLAGGISSERQVSLQSGENIASALEQAGFEVVTSDIAPDNLDILEDSTIDVFYLALHGTFGEDGQLQQILEDRSLCFTGSGAEASRIAFDKCKSKDLFGTAGAIVPRDVRLDGTCDADGLTKRLAGMGEKFVVKPVCEGSSVGVQIVQGVDAAVAAGLDCYGQFGDCIVEQFITGKEITVGILEGKSLPIIEIRSNAVFYDYQAKYEDDTTEYLFDTVHDAELIEKISRTAQDCFNVLNCRHLARVDMIIDDDGTAYVLEINTLPGFTSHSLLPMAAKKAGINAPALCSQIVHAAMAG